jgi:hypothetical protein
LLLFPLPVSKLGSADANGDQVGAVADDADDDADDDAVDE